MRSILVILWLLSAFGLTACRQAPSGEGTSKATPRGDKRPAILRPADDPRVKPYFDRFQRVEVLLTRWDALRADGRTGEADAIAQRIREEVDGAFPDFERGSRGEIGPHAQYLCVSALGFSARPRATVLLVERLSDRDARVIGNTLISISNRSDPQTPVEPLVRFLAPGVPQEPRRYAPLALAKVLEARARGGRPADPGLEQQILARLAPLAVDQDAVVRLHVAKALGVLRTQGAVEYLRVLVGDPQMRIRWAAAAGLEQHADPRGFPEVIRLLHDAAPESKHVIRDILVSYAARLQGRPLTAQEAERLGVGARAWSQWYATWSRSRGLDRRPSPARPR